MNFNTPLEPARIRALATGRVITPGDEGYDQARTIHAGWSVYISSWPGGIGERIHFRLSRHFDS